MERRVKEELDYSSRERGMGTGPSCRRSGRGGVVKERLYQQ